MRYLMSGIVWELCLGGLAAIDKKHLRALSRAWVVLAGALPRERLGRANGRARRSSGGAWDELSADAVSRVGGAPLPSSVSGGRKRN